MPNYAGLIERLPSAERLEEIASIFEKPRKECAHIGEMTRIAVGCIRLCAAIQGPAPDRLALAAVLLDGTDHEVRPVRRNDGGMFSVARE